MTSARSRRFARPADAFPDGDWRSWRSHVLTVDIEPIHAAVIAERLERFLEQARQDGRSMRDIAARTGISHTSLSTMTRCLSYAMEGIVARLQDTYPIDLNPVAEVRAVKLAAQTRRSADVEERLAQLQSRYADLATRHDSLQARYADLLRRSGPRITAGDAEGSPVDSALCTPGRA